ncbi:hypothetical protein Q0M94_19930 (plasmid) [Deinococcus radiomollis]|uniref:hypothetical protein n=1 Tax=Deinococcus radiomollis TaxID=468916 RepID=UPI0038914D55
MKRRKIVAACLLRSLSKRLWLVVLPAVALCLLGVVLQLPFALSLVAALVLALAAATGVCWSSYVRHLEEFPTTGFATLSPPLIAEE